MRALSQICILFNDLHMHSNVCMLKNLINNKKKIPPFLIQNTTTAINLNSVSLIKDNIRM